MITSIELDHVFTKREGLVCRRIVDETIVVPIKGHVADMQKLFVLNPVAEHIWDDIDGNNSLQDIRNHLEDSFEVDTNQADSDLKSFFGELVAADLIVRNHQL